MKTAGLTLRQSLEMLLAGLSCLLLSPVLCLIAVAVKLGDGGPIFYSQVRVGRNFESFRLLKFRTMVTGADKGGLLTRSGDARTTRVGRILRRSKLDELPQLANVLKGEMQFVGPRPEVAHYVDLFRDEYALLLRDRPGITDPASLAYRDEEQLLDGPQVEHLYISRILPDKLRISLQYQKRRNLLSDLGVALSTLFARQVAQADSVPPEGPRVSNKIRIS